MATILIVDDSIFMQRLKTTYLRQAGHTIVGVCFNGEEGFHLYQELHPDVVVLNVQLPLVNGIECLKQIIRYDAHAFVVMCCALGHLRIRIDVLRLGAQDYVLNAFIREKLVEVVETTLRKKKR